jgi:NAD(P)-dependent dehydrogenase (short-subunit alcohol dehydrogenase family)
MLDRGGRVGFCANLSEICGQSAYLLAHAVGSKGCTMPDGSNTAGLILDDREDGIFRVHRSAFVDREIFEQERARRMIERGTSGAIINIISTAGHQGEPGNIAYSTAKSGLLNFTRSAAMELVRYGIRVNSLTPTATDRSESYDRAERWGRTVTRPNAAAPASNAFRSRVPMQRLPVPSDYGRAAVFLASDDARMITGTDLRVDAGAIARYWAWDPSAP